MAALPIAVEISKFRASYLERNSDVSIVSIALVHTGGKVIARVPNLTGLLRC